MDENISLADLKRYVAEHVETAFGITDFFITYAELFEEDALWKEIEIIGLKGSKKLEALSDSGAGGNFVREIFRDGVSVQDLGFIM